MGEEGAKTVVDEAKKRVKEILAVHHPEPIDEVTKREVRMVVNEAEKGS